MAVNATGAKLREFVELFSGQQTLEVPEFEELPAVAVPRPYHDLLVHENHMTVTVERFHGRRVELQVLARARRGDHYARMILLTLEGTGEVVQFGIMRVDLRCCSDEVRSEILAGHTPLGRILIEHGVLRQIDPSAFLRITPTPSLMNWFGMQHPQPLYGRLATICCDGLPAIELLEVVRPEDAGHQASTSTCG